MTIDNALLPVRTTIAGIEPNTRIDEIAAALGLLEALADAIKAMKAELKDRMLAWVTVNGDLTIGDKRYYAGVESDVKCSNPAEVLIALLEAADLETTAACLASNAWKHGAVGKVLPADVYDRLFTRTVKNVLADGKPRKALLTVDTRFLPARQSA